MTICARFNGMRIYDCTRGESCHCANESGFRMIYAERNEDQGVFLSIAEFAPYRALGWSGSPAVNHAADAYLFALGTQELSHE